MIYVANYIAACSRAKSSISTAYQVRGKSPAAGCIRVTVNDERDTKILWVPYNYLLELAALCRGPGAEALRQADVRL